MPRVDNIIKCLKQLGVKNKEVLDTVKQNYDDPKFDQILAEAERKAAVRKRQAILQKEKLTAINEDMADKVDNDYHKGKYLMDSISGGGVRGKGVMPLEREIQGVLSYVHRFLGDMMERYKPKWLGFSVSKKAQRLMIREIYKKGSTGDPDAQAYADAWTKAAEYLRVRYNNAGGDIPKLEDWNLPQTHVVERMKNKEEWVSFVKDRIINDRLGANDSQVQKTLESIYDNLVSDGFQKIDTSYLPATLRKSIGNRHQEHRLLHFKNADAWMEYSDMYGARDYYNSMMNYTEMMAREIGAMEKFGPNSDAVVDRLLKEAASEGHNVSLVKNTYDYLMNRNLGNSNKISDIFQALRNLSVVTKLGRAPLTALTDPVYAVMAAKMNGMSSLRLMKRYIKRLLRQGAAGKDLNRLGVLGEYAINRATASARYADVSAYGLTAKIADASTRASGLNPMTVAAKEVFQAEMLSNLARMGDKSFDQLPRKIRASLSRYNITANDWANMRGKTTTIKGEDLLDVSQMPDEKLTGKVVAMLKEETQLAIPEPNAKVKAAIRLGQPKGTLAGEIIRSIGQFKSFGLSIHMSNHMRVMNMRFPSAISYLGGLVVGNTAMGMIVLWAKDASNGKTPRDITPEFMVEAMMQGGITGIIGDFIFEDPRAYGGIAQRVAGPIIGDAIDGATYLWGTKQQVMSGQTTIREALAKTGYDVGSKLAEPLYFWYLKLAVERGIMDNLDQMMDPKWDQKQLRKSRYMAEQGSDWWWEPGSGAKGFRPGRVTEELPEISPGALGEADITF